MSTNETSVVFPIDRLKAETLRAIARDMNLPTDGRKEDVMQRLRTTSASGWATGTPSKRKADDPLERLATDKKPKIPQSVGAVEASESPSRDHAADAIDLLHREEANRAKSDVNGNAMSKGPTFDDYFVAGTTNIFITGDDMCHLMAGDSNCVMGGLWKPAAAFAQVDAELDQRIHHWVVLEPLQNVSEFEEVCKELFEKERNDRKSGLKDDTAKKADEGAKEGDKNDVKKNEAAETWWYELSVSRVQVKGALGIKLIRGYADPVDVAIMECVGADAEVGDFWLSNPRAGGQDDAKLLSQVVEVVYNQF